MRKRNSIKWGICPVCEKRCLHGATIHYNCWKSSFGWNSDELRAYVRTHNALPGPKSFSDASNPSTVERTTAT